MKLRVGSIAGPELEMPPGPKLSDQIVAPVCPSSAIRWPCSPCTYTTSLTPLGVVTSCRYTGAPSGASGRETLNSCLRFLTLARVTVDSAVSLADLPGSKANCGQSYLVGAGAACALCGVRTATAMTVPSAATRAHRLRSIPASPFRAYADDHAHRRGGAGAVHRTIRMAAGLSTGGFRQGEVDNVHYVN